MSTERKITIIEPVRQKIGKTTTGAPEKLRVAAYARVSTEQDEQQSSYEAQVDFYTRYIKNNPNWEFVAVFADEGITGTNTKKRDGFNLMIQKAMNGEIDLILTKSISRFARNTVDTLQTVRNLKAAGVEVIFEKENLHTFDPKCEVKSSAVVSAEMLYSDWITVTVQVAETPLLSAAVAMMVAVPSFTAVTLPLLSTVAMVSSLLSQVTALLVAFSGVTVAVRVAVLPVYRDRLDSFSETLATGTDLIVSVYTLLSLPLALVAVTVKVEVPAAVGVPEIVPLLSSVNHSGLSLELHVMLLPVACSFAV